MDKTCGVMCAADIGCVSRKENKQAAGQGQVGSDAVELRPITEDTKG